jgi:hypothetical protein
LPGDLTLPRTSTLIGRGLPPGDSLIARLRARVLPDGTRLELVRVLGDDAHLTIVAHGKSSHGGVNIEGGRNALVALARATEGLLPASGENDLLAFARLAGQDLHGTGLGLTESDPVWGRYLVNVATVKPRDDGRLRLEVVLRRPPPLAGPQIKAYLEKVVAAFNARRGLADRRQVLGGRAVVVRPRSENRQAASRRVHRRDRGDRFTGGRRRRNLREAAAQQHRFRDVVPGRALPRP